ncbi:MAG: N-acetyltransferase [Comamonadaceae bacterium]|nr:MAG: N-acetyltransferase [Comamonadaceae bacterium]
MELRIDVAPTHVSVDDELRELQRRFARRLQAQCAPLSLRLNGLRFWHREADAEHYVYVECMSDNALVGYAVLNRLVEVSRALDPHVRSPHTRIAEAFQGRGIASAIYRWALDSGLCLVSGARQSPGAHALWSSLGRRYHLAYVHIVDKELRLLGPHAPSALREHLHTRLMLFGVEAKS